MKFLITGNTGFKGTWLSFMLKSMGHEVYGLALSPVEKSMFTLTSAERLINHQLIEDVRNSEAIDKFIKDVEPDILIHLAAQPLVIDSYLYPRLTFETNALGTFNVLEATRNLENLRATLIITTDKVYKNLELIAGYSETDALGGDDPYSASKAMADILTQAWRKSYGSSPISIARAGNVIGGGDFSKNRIIPDIMKKIFENKDLNIRSISSIRPWQHVLDCLNGYLNLVDHMLGNQLAGEFNFAPDPESFKSVKNLISTIEEIHGIKISFDFEDPYYKETEVLTLKADKAKQILNFKNHLDFDATVRLTYDWYRAFYLDQEPMIKTESQVKNFLNSITFKNI